MSKQPARKRRNPEEVAATKKKKRRKMAAWSRSSFIGPRTTKQLEHMTRLKRRKLVASTRAAHKAMIARVEGKIPAGSHKVAYLYPHSSEFVDSKGKARKHHGFVSASRIGQVKPKFTITAHGKGKLKEYGIVKNPKHRKSSHKRRNPDYQIAGVPVIPMAGGAAVSIALSAFLQGMLTADSGTGSILSKLPGLSDPTSTMIVDYHVDQAIAPALVAAASAFGYTKMSGQGKEIAKYAFLGSAFEVLNIIIGGKIRSAVAGTVTAKTTGVSKFKAGDFKNGKDGETYKSGDLAPDGKVAGMRGYMNVATGQRAAGGMHGMYMTADGASHSDMGGSLNLYQGKSLYGV